MILRDFASSARFLWGPVIRDSEICSCVQFLGEEIVTLHRILCMLDVDFGLVPKSAAVTPAPDPVGPYPRESPSPR